MHKQQDDNGKKFVDEDDDVIYIPAKGDGSNSIPELDIEATAVEGLNHTYLVEDETADEYDIYKTIEDIIFLNHMMCLCGKLDVVEAEIGCCVNIERIKRRVVLIESCVKKSVWGKV